MPRRAALTLCAWLACAPFATAAADHPTQRDRAIPRYDHVFVIVEENKNYEQILDPRFAPNIARFAAEYGNATQFFGEVHPSEANYVALLGGDTFGIHDDDAFYCKPGQSDRMCPGSAGAGYVDHTVHAPHLGDQLRAKGLDWKGYFEDLPQPGSLAVVADETSVNDLGKPALYASKHSGFVNFASTQADPRRAEHLVDFRRFDADLKADKLPAFALIVPNQCNEMHGLRNPGLPADCGYENIQGLIARGDRVVGEIVAKLQATPAWRSRANVAIIVTFDEGSGKTREGCCGVTPEAISNFGGGHIPMIVITNHGPRGRADATPYNHYSLLRTLEDAFGVGTHLGHAAETDKGVVAMSPLFETR